MSTLAEMQQQKPVLVLGGTASGVGKTSIAVGLMAALRWVQQTWCWGGCGAGAAIH